MPNKEKEPPNPLVTFRCPKDIADEFERNADSCNWRTQDVLRTLVMEFNALFEGGQRPQWPLRVVGGSPPQPQQPAALPNQLSAPTDALVDLLAERLFAKLESKIERAEQLASTSSRSRDERSRAARRRKG